MNAVERQVVAIRADFEEGGDFHFAEADVRQGVEFDVFERDILDDAWNRRLVIPSRQIVLAVGLLVELETVGVADMLVMAVVNLAIERFAARENFSAGKEADFVSRAVDILHEHVVDRAECDSGKPPVPSIKGDEIVAGLALHAADDAVGGRAVDVDAVHLVVVEGDVFDDEIIAARDENAVEIATADGDVADREIACVAEEEHAEQIAAAAFRACRISLVAVAVDETTAACAEGLDDGVGIAGADA